MRKTKGRESPSVRTWSKGVGNRPLSSVEQKHQATRIGVASPNTPEQRWRPTEAKEVYMKQLSGCLEHECDGWSSSNYFGPQDDGI